MIDLMRAEWLKIRSNVRLTSSLVWIFPIGAATILIVGILINLGTGEFSGYTSISRWTTDSVLIWGFINQFPGNVFGRLLPLAFLAVVFAGEYQWQTWKNIIPRSRRLTIFIAKLLTSTIVVLASCVVTSIVILILQWVGHQVLGAQYGPEVTFALVGETILTFFQETLVAFLSLLILGSFAAVAAFITRSMMGALLLSFGFSIAEIMSLWVLVLFSIWFDKPNIVNVFRYLPGFNLENLRSWMVLGHGWTDLPMPVTIEVGIGESIVWIVIWVLLLAGWAYSIFHRQDITA